MSNSFFWIKIDIIFEHPNTNHYFILDVDYSNFVYIVLSNYFFLNFRIFSLIFFNIFEKITTKTTFLNFLNILFLFFLFIAIDFIFFF
jgi:hypothetical protein